MAMPYVPQVPGGSPPTDDEPPAILLWVRVYAGLLTVSYIGIALLGVLIATGGIFAATGSAKGGTAAAAQMLIQGVILAIVGTIFIIPGSLAIWAPRRKWTWFLCLVLIGKGVMTCCLPMALPILLGWLKPEVKKYYGVLAAAARLRASVACKASVTRSDPMPSAERPISPRLAWSLTLVATFTMSISYVDRQAFAILAPSFTRDLGIADDRYGQLLSAFSIAYLVGAPLAGRFIDWIGARRGLLVAVLGWSIVAGLHAIAPGAAVFFVLRVALGLAESPSFPGSAQTVHRALSPADRPRGFGILFTGSSIGAMLVAPLASRLAAAYGWRAAFVLTAVVGLVWVPVWLALAFRADSRAILDRPPSATEIATKMSVPELLRHRDVQRAMVLVLATAPAIAFILNWSAKYLSLEFELSQKEIGNYLWFPPILFDIGAVAFGDWASRRQRRRGAALAPERELITAAAILCAMIVLMPFVSSPGLATLVAGVSLAGGGAVYALLTADMLSRVPASAVATAGGLTAAAQSLTHIAFLPIVGSLKTHYGSYTIAVIGLGLWVLPLTGLWLVMSRARPTVPMQAPSASDQGKSRP